MKTTRRGQPLVSLEPIHNPRTEREGIWKKRERHFKGYELVEPAEPDFGLPARLPRGAS